MVNAGMLNDTLLIDLSNGNTIELTLEQVLSLSPHSIGRDERASSQEATEDSTSES